MYKIIFYVPPSHLDVVKNAVFQTGAGKVGQYSHCAWQVLGEGQFMPLQHSQAFIGAINTLERINEYRVELVCDKNDLHAAISALKSAHPYEEPAYQVIKLEEI